MRGYRPSFYADLEDEERDEQALLAVRTANVHVYARRAKSGLPLFEKAAVASPRQQAPDVTATGPAEQPATATTSHYAGSS